MAVIASRELKDYFGSSGYKEAIGNAARFNRQLKEERTLRLPFFDSQSAIQQMDCFMWRSRFERGHGFLPGQVFSYVPRRWRITTEPLISESTTTMMADNEVKVTIVAPSLSSASVEHPVGVSSTKKTTRTTDLFKKGEARSNKYRIDDSDSEEEEPDASEDLHTEEYSDDDNITITSKRRTRKQRAVPVLQRPKREKTAENSETPFFCAECVRYYKTQPALKAHITKCHGGSSTNVSSNTILANPQSASSTVKDTYHPASQWDEKTIQKSSRRSSTSTISGEGENSLSRKKIKKPQSRMCDFCWGDDRQNKATSKPEKMVKCAKCDRCAHPSCLKCSPELAAIMMTYEWECIDCKTCVICSRSDQEDQMLFCDDCDRGYHMFCVKPPIKEPPEGSWSCEVCELRLGKK